MPTHIRRDNHFSSQASRDGGFGRIVVVVWQTATTALGLGGDGIARLAAGRRSIEIVRLCLESARGDAKLGAILVVHVVFGLCCWAGASARAGRHERTRRESLGRADRVEVTGREAARECAMEADAAFGITYGLLGGCRFLQDECHEGDGRETERWTRHHRS
jgi:hypothetical protein